MTITFSHASQPSQVVAKIVGDVDLYTTPEFQSQVNKVVDTVPTHLLLDFADVTYLDSSGVGALIRLLQKTKKAGTKLAISNLQATPRKILTMSNVLSILPSVDDAAAIKAFYGNA